MANSKIESRVLFTIIIALAIFFAWLLFKPEKKQPTIIKIVDLSEFRSLPMFSAGNLAVVRLKINNTEGAFIIDTGAEESIFNSSYLDSLKISISDSIPIPNTHIYLTDTVKVTAADSLFHFDKQFFTYDLSNMKNKIVENDSTFKNSFFLGILGQDLMRQEGMILNFQNNKIYLTNKYNKIE